MRKLILTALLALALLPAAACSSGGSSETGLGSVSDSLGIDASGGALKAGATSYGGLNGDGLTFVEIAYDDDRILNQIEGNAAWNELPASEVVEILLYGASTEREGYVVEVGPYIGEDGMALFPGWRTKETG